MSKTNCGDIIHLFEQLQHQHLNLKNSPNFRYKIMPELGISDLRYILYEPCPNKYVWGTLKQFKDSDEAWYHFSLLRKCKSKYVLHADRYLKDNGNHYLIFPVIVTNLRCWLQKYNWSDEDVYKIFRKIGRCTQYLFDESKSYQVDLVGGFCITEDNEAYLWNLCEGINNGGSLQHIPKEIAQRIIEYKGEHAMKQSNSPVWKWLTGYLDFLKKLSSLSESPSHCAQRLLDEFGLNYPIFWEEKQSIQFIANLQRIGRQDTKRLSAHYDFVTPLHEKLQKDWIVKGFRNRVLNSILTIRNPDELKNLSLRTKATKTSYAACDLALYANNCLKHYGNVAKKLGENEKEVNRTPAEVLKILCSEYPFLVESLYEALFAVVMDGYRHKRFTIHQILKEKLN